MSFDFTIIESNKISGLKQILLSSFTDHRGALFSFFDKDITNRILPNDLNYSDIKGLSNEVTAKLNDIKPESIGQASRISGITPAAISILLIHLKKSGVRRKAG